MRTITIRGEEELIQAVDQVAKSYQISREFFIRRALADVVQAELGKTVRVSGHGTWFSERWGDARRRAPTKSAAGKAPRAGAQRKRRSKRRA